MTYALAVLLSVTIGLALGLLGGGGTILTVPILVHGLGVDPKAAIASSLVVVGVTSATALVPHARAGNVDWRTGATFGVAGMLGAFAGGRLAAVFSEQVLLVLFSLVMIGTALAMLRPAPAPAPGPAPRHAARRVLADGFVVGAVTGLVGAGGGFLVVPALALLGGLPMPKAVGTSLLVIAMKSFAGFLGHAGHVSIDWGITGIVAAVAVTGSLAGARLARHVRPDGLRRGFAVLVLALATFQLVTELSPEDLPMPAPSALAPLAGGALIGLAASILLLAHGRVAGISGILGGLLERREGDTAWRLWFLGGLVAAGVLGALVAPSSFAYGVDRSLPAVAAAGLAVGVGTRLGSGCTSGHGVCGIARLSPRSLVATATFIAAGAVTVWIVEHALGGGR